MGNLLMKFHLVFLDYRIDPEPRYGYGRPPHPGLAALFDEGEDIFRHLLEDFLRYSDWLLKIPLDQPSSSYRGPFWRNGYLPALDGVSLYCMMAALKPRRYFEIGSGNSTRFVRRAISDHGLDTKVTSIDPAPRSDVDEICDRVIRRPIEQLDLLTFEALEAGDLLFVDDGHRVFPSSGPSVFFMDVLPGLPAGLTVCIHDIFLPWDYPPEWERLYYSEQYLLAVMLLAGDRVDILFPAFHVSQSPGLRSVLDPLLSHPSLAGAETHGCGFWFRIKD